MKKQNKPTTSLKVGINKKATSITNKALITAYIISQLWLATWVPFNKNTNYNDVGFRKNLLKNTKEMLTANKVTFQKNKNWPETNMNFIYPWNIILNKEWDEITETRSIKIPYKLAPDFKLAEAINNEDYNEFYDVIERWVEGVLNPFMVGHRFSIEEYKKNNIKNTNKFTIHIHEIKWSASPEASKYGDKSLLPGNEEKENIDLAEKHRAQDAKWMIIQVFQNIISKNSEFVQQIDTSSMNILWTEEQLIQEELDKLDSLAKKLWYQRVVDMIKANDKWEITDSSVSRLIDDVITSKRYILITFSIKWQEENVYVIPLFLPIMVLIPRARLIKKYKPILPDPIPVYSEKKYYVPKETWNKNYSKTQPTPYTRKQPKDIYAHNFSQWGGKSRSRKWRTWK